MKPVSLLNDLLSRVTDIGKRLDLSSKVEKESIVQQCERLMGLKGEATGLAHAQEILDRYKQLELEDKQSFFMELLNQFGMSGDELEKAIENWQQNQDQSSARRLHFASEPRSQNLLRRLNQAPGATLALVEMRSDLLKTLAENPVLKELDKDFSHLFASWFNKGFLQLQRIDWATSAEVLEKVIAYEAVHEINGWDELRQRVASADRRLYGYFHPALGTEPLIFVEVALTDQVPSAIEPILAKDRPALPPEKATTAVFYSISNCQRGLKGISFGNFLIKQVVETLRQEFENLETFITLSPIPGFRNWAFRQSDDPDTILNDRDLDLIDDLSVAETDGTIAAFAEDKSSLLELAAKYLVNARAPIGGAIDPVARFHLGNGARLENIHLLGDVSANGINNSWGCMVNYQYHVKDIEKNHEAYVNNDDVIVSQNVSRLVKAR